MTASAEPVAASPDGSSVAPQEATLRPGRELTRP
jgi:hypothetical protein